MRYIAYERMAMSTSFAKKCVVLGAFSVMVGVASLLLAVLGAARLARHIPGLTGSPTSLQEVYYSCLFVPYSSFL